MQHIPNTTVDRIEAIGIDANGSLWVKPATKTFPMMYREGMEVHWDASRQCLYSPLPREWSYLQWFCQINRAAAEQGVALVVDSQTQWNNLDQHLRDEIVRTVNKADLSG
ncbi:hypothetical protein [Terriglobus roseus]|uniref:hypothetical protein n=1 Tax=Terriglobus roseus TaxID=392734 RepID=UPI0009F2408A|nr:hypothetical protein [Terriglobus roseus]